MKGNKDMKSSLSASVLTDASAPMNRIIARTSWLIIYSSTNSQLHYNQHDRFA